MKVYIVTSCKTSCSEHVKTTADIYLDEIEAMDEMHAILADFGFDDCDDFDEVKAKENEVYGRIGNDEYEVKLICKEI